MREVIAARLHLVPRFRQPPYVPRPGLGRPLWVDAPAFDLAGHVQVLPVPDPGDEAALLRAAEQLRRRRLDRSRPLWQMWLLPGLAELPGLGMYVKIHHLIGDATWDLAALAALLDPAPGTPAGPAPPWMLAPPPTARELLADNLRHYATWLGHAAAALARPVTTTRHARAAWTAMREVTTGRPPPGPAWTAWSAPAAPRAPSAAAWTRFQQAAHRHHATVNDGLLRAPRKARPTTSRLTCVIRGEFAPGGGGRAPFRAAGGRAQLARSITLGNPPEDAARAQSADLRDRDTCGAY